VQFTDVEQKARAASARAKWVEAQTQFMRMQDMLARKLIAKADFDKAEALYKSADAALKEAEEIAANTAVYAPYGGVVVSRSVKVGETVAPGTPLMTGLSLEHLRVQVDIPQRHIGAIRTFKTARITLANGLMVKTHDLRISPSADPLSHAFKILVNLPQGDYTQEPGTLVKVHFVSGSEEQLLIDAQAVAQRGEVNGVYTLAEQSIDFRLVRLGTRTKEGKYPVLAGLQAGERIAQDPVAAAAAYKKAHSRLVQ
jgi:RND family efflux transporter MFP subunit